MVGLVLLENRGRYAVAIATRGAAACAAALAFLPLLSVLGTPVPFGVKLFLVTIAVAGAAAPGTGLLVIAAFVPLATVVRELSQVPWRGTQLAEVVLLAFLAGWFLTLAVRGRRGIPARLRYPLVTLTALTAASAVVHLAGQVPNDNRWAWLAEGWMGYLDQDPRFQSLYAACRTLEGLGVLAAVASSASADRAVLHRLVRMLVAGLSAAAALNVIRFIQICLATADPLAAAASYLRWIRINVHHPDLNAAGSVLALGLLLAGGLAAGSRGIRRLAWTTVAAVLASGVWLTGSRTAAAATLLGVVWILTRQKVTGVRRRRLAIALGWAAAILLAVGVLVKSPRAGASADPLSATSIRIELVTRAIRMAGDHPLFGAGAGTFRLNSNRYASPRSFGPENAHNDMAQMTGELGFPGLVAFLWLLAAVVYPLFRYTREPGSDVRAVWLLGALGTFLLTGLAGHPLIVLEAAIPFWVACGLAVAWGGKAPDGQLRLARHAAVFVVCAVCISLPFRAYTALPQPQPESRWQRDGNITYRDAGAAETLFVPPPHSTVLVPVRIAVPPGAPGEAIVEVSLNGRPRNRVVILADRWTMVKVVITSREGFADRRIDLVLQQPPPGARLLVGLVRYP